jgi:sugar/nucleoside kinase (ribokinase family)
MMGGVRISGLGCTLLDFVYNGIDFSSPVFRKYSSREAGDGGLMPGQLVFLEDLEKFAGLEFETIIRDIAGDRDPDAFNVGGPAIVSVIHAAQLLGGESDIRFLAAIGNDWVGQRILDILSHTPVSSRDFVRKDARTPFTNVLSDPEYNGGRGERTFINNLGAAGELVPEDLPEGFLQGDILALGGTALVPQVHDRLDEILAMAAPDAFRLVNTVFDFRSEQRNPGQPWPVGKDHGSFNSIDLLIMNREEAQKISGQPSLDKALAYFTASPLKAFMVTDGTEPVSVYADPDLYGSHGYDPAVKLPVSRPLFDLSLSDKTGADTTGAGDNYVGGVLYSLASQLNGGRRYPDLVEAARWGIVSGGFACTYMGGTFLEDHAGQKMEAVSRYHEMYRQQLNDG